MDPHDKQGWDPLAGGPATQQASHEKTLGHWLLGATGAHEHAQQATDHAVVTGSTTSNHLR
eukprot:16129475-Heterocapsa_arctica.AAC.1